MECEFTVDSTPLHSIPHGPCTNSRHYTKCLDRMKKTSSNRINDKCHPLLIFDPLRVSIVGTKKSRRRLPKNHLVGDFVILVLVLFLQCREKLIY